MTAPSIDPDALEPTIDLSLTQQKRILLFESQLKADNYYQVLGVEPEAPKSQIRQAYFALMNEFHADRYYGKSLGGFAARMRTIVEGLTRANDVLTKKKARLAYDERLKAQGLLRHAPSRAQEAPATRSEAAAPPAISNSPRRSDLGGASHTREVQDSDLKAPNRAPSAPHLIDRDLTMRGGVQVTNSPDDATQSSSAPPKGRGDGSVSQAAKRNLARKMKRISRPPPNSTDHSTDHDSVRQAVAQDLRSRYNAKKKAQERAERDHVDKYTNLADIAQESGDWASAVNALKMAMELCPEDPALQKRLSALQTQADRALAPRFTEQAQSEEKDARYLQAARSYERAARGKNSAELYEKSAHCYLKDGGLGDTDIRKLVEVARQAVNLDNESVAYRVTLARAYYAAGMKSSAQGEVGRALSLQPDNNNAKQLQKLLK